jgi:hypothetical protein
MQPTARKAIGLSSKLPWRSVSAAIVAEFATHSSGRIWYAAFSAAATIRQPCFIRSSVISGRSTSEAIGLFPWRRRERTRSRTSSGGTNPAGILTPKRAAPSLAAA